LEDEYWAQIKFITGRGNAAFSDNFFAFRSFYFYSIPIGLTGQKIWKFRTYTKEDFMSRMQPYCDVVRKEDALDLPAQVHEIRKIHLNANERKAYDTMKNELVLYLENTPIVAQTALVEVMKLRQLTSGFAYSANGAKKISPVSSKFIELKMLLQELGRKQVIIWANFKEEIEQLLTLDDSRALFSDTEDRSKDIADFKAGKFQYYIIHPQSGGHGLTFTNCNYSIYYSLCYSYELLKQSQDRIHRIGQTDKCTYYYLLADKTIDEVIYRAITNKEKASNIVLEFLKNEKISM
jgi:SNF2 family DNA or RNA helicase